MATEWINPRYADVMAGLRRRQAAAPREVCTRCKGAGSRPVPGGGLVACTRCTGAGRIVGGVRMFVTG